MKPGDLVKFKAGYERTYGFIGKIGILLELHKHPEEGNGARPAGGKILIEGMMFHHYYLTELIELFEE